MTKLIAFKGKQEIKDKYIARVKAHTKADEIVKGKYWENGKGCAVGCTIHSSHHLKYETQLGIPRSIAKLEDRIFEGLPNKEAKNFPVEFLASINVGADLSQITGKFLVWLFTDKKEGVINYTKKNSEQYKVIKNIAKLWEKVLRREIVTIEEWIKARNTAVNAADAAYAAYATYASDAAYTAYASASAYTAYAAAYAAYADVSDADDAYDAVNDASAYTAYAAAYAAAAYDAYAAKEKFFSKQAKYLIKLLKEAR